MRNNNGQKSLTFAEIVSMGVNTNDSINIFSHLEMT